MARAWLTIPLLAIGGCSGGGGTAAPSGGSVSTPAPAPAPTPAPTPTPTPTPAPPASAPARFADIYSFRYGAGVTLPSACAGITSAPTPAALPVSAWGQGLVFRFVLTPQVWSIAGEVAVGFDGRDADGSVQGAEVALAKTIGADRYALRITQPFAAEPALLSARSARVDARVGGMERRHDCVLGLPTAAGELAAADGSYPRTVLRGVAYVRDATGTRSYLLDMSAVTLVLDRAGRRVTATLRLVGTPEGGGAPLELGTASVAGVLDPATGSIAGPLAIAGRTVGATLRGQVFGQNGAEVGAALGGTVDAAGNAPAVIFSATLFAAR
ncbi:hypothetical protein SAMN06297144_1708 [Sphingomonas guangdongensis]|uniref:Transferrin-binding protein B C-lobe/N-lobe beta barrel domain-containing protein n=1 Tax=Sphingomonas guangdongensis TaxID=1141890 RepID=A0A285QXN6_9SPHN|nr:hypothetical protein [Sphingomonas guangdongensis]SOB86601.1 hypothetical protein SAMN06297144_1708 [Sphingomonas guangdongensis]